MLKRDLMLRNPLTVFGADSENALPKGEIGAITARAGVGKTALVVQIALNSLLRDINVLHVSLQDPVQKVGLWYKEVFKNTLPKNAETGVNELWNDLAAHRFIMTFQIDEFTAPKLKERMDDLIEQNIFIPRVLLIDGLPLLGVESTKMLNELKSLAAGKNLSIWLTVQTHREEAPGKDGLPVQLSGISELFDVILQLQPDGKNIHIRASRGGMEGMNTSPLLLDPSTMLVMNKGD